MARTEPEGAAALECLKLASASFAHLGYRPEEIAAAAATYLTFVTGTAEKSVRQQINDLLDASNVI